MKFILTCNISSNKRRSKVPEKNMSCECALNFDQWITFSENYNPMKVWLWLVYKIYRELLLLVTFLRVHSNSKELPTSWQNMYPNLKTTCHIKLKFFLWTKLLENLLQAKYLISVAAPLTFQSLHQHAKLSSVHPLFHPFTLWPPVWLQPFLTTFTPIFLYQLLIRGINM